ncbi:hypothetical protein AcW1_003803 [Taiwanofungus camphoratus]|nr:hypothetical protein AcV5_003513 [Antrodia cinnamomea]KAI0940669.1 hypothetical protein AcW1_003803 [Antrodia cinnamomea]
MIHSDDANKCAETIQKLIDLRRNSRISNRMQLADALSLICPESPLYPALSTLPPPDPTNSESMSAYFTQAAIQNSLPVLEEIVSLHEQEEEEMIRKEIAKRRTRLGAAGPEELQKEVNREILGSSRLPNLYSEIMNHPNTPDDLRRATESKLLRHKQRLLYALPAVGISSSRKALIAAELEDLVNGMVMLGIRDELAWYLFIEGKDATTLEEYDYGTLRQVTRLFPDSPLAKLITSYFGYIAIPHDDEDQDPSRQKDETIIKQEDTADMIMDAFANLPDSIFAHRVVAEVYQCEQDLENAIKVAGGGLEQVRRAEQNNGRPMPRLVFTLRCVDSLMIWVSTVRVKKAFNIVLATSLVHHFPPKHHSRALGIISEILSQDANNVPCLMGRGYVLAQAGRWEEAGEVFAQVVELMPESLVEGLRSKEEHAWCRAMCMDPDGAATELREVISTLDALEDRVTDKARCWWRLGRCYWDMGDQAREEAYRYFITSLKYSPTFAPAFTSLGIYYSEFLSPSDPNRASKCFQKAFELDPREADAARRLAKGFADEQEWDLVEVVARRTIDGEGGLESGNAATRYLPINAWAWKAIGVVELNRRNCSLAIQALQIALRTDTEDQHSWLRLGEAYSKAGRFAAAVKALQWAHELGPDDWVCSYFMGEVQRHMGDHNAAIKSFESILVKHPSELGVLLSLGQAHLDLGRAELSTAYTSRAESSFMCSIRLALQLIDASPGFRRVVWKFAADAIFELSKCLAYSDETGIREMLPGIISLVSDHPGKGLSGILSLPMSMEDSNDLSLFMLELAVSAYHYRISLGSLDDKANGSAHFDLGMALCSYARRLPSDSRQQLSQQEAIRNFKEALRLEPSNDQYWTALGDATFESQPRTAQHAYIKALEIDGKNAMTWTNLGLLYLHNNNSELANEAFYKAQTLDPDYALAWVGQGLVATFNGPSPEARALFEHAVGLTAIEPGADLEFAKQLFNKLSTPEQSRTPLDSLFSAFFVLDRFCKKRPQDASALHLFGLVCERIGHIELGIEMINAAISHLEAAYEETEDPTIEKQFAIAHANVARMRLSIQSYEGAIESFQVATGLLPEEPEDRTTRVLLAQAHFGSGVAKFKLGQLPEALRLFEAAMGFAANDPVIHGHVVVLLAQVLWAMRTEEAHESAKAQLLQSIQSNPENLIAVYTLAGMGILTDDDSLVDAALSEIVSLPLDLRLGRDPGRDATYLLIQHHLGQGNATQALSIAQKAVFTEPSRPEIRHELASLMLQRGRSHATLAVLAGSAREDELTQLRDSLAFKAVARCMNKEKQEAHKLAQKAIMLSPWKLRNWHALAYVRSHSVS